MGRSNAGKSSAINALCQRRRLAFASKTPGRTQALNFFSLGRETEVPRAYIVDTPGYGYAATPQAVRQSWDRLAGYYLSSRASLAGVVLVLDSRRGLTALDEQLLAFVPQFIPLLALLTKSDKLGFAERGRTQSTVARALDNTSRNLDLTLIAFSANTGLGVDAVRDLLDAWIVRAEESGQQPGQKKTPTDSPVGE